MIGVSLSSHGGVASIGSPRAELVSRFGEDVAECARAAEPRVAPSANLEKVTLDPPIVWDVVLAEVAEGRPGPGQLGAKVVTYSDGVRVSIWRRPEFRCSSREADESGSAPDVALSSTGPNSGTSEDGQSRSDASIARSRKLVRHRARCLGVHSLWTFTKRGKFDSLDDVWLSWRRFHQLMRRRYRAKWRYVAVPELHADGETWHLHVLFGDFYLVETLRRFWYRALGATGNETGDSTPGSVNVKKLRASCSSARGAANYVAKYVGKGFERGGHNRRVFSCSAGLHPVAVARWRSPVDVGIVEFTDTVGRRVSVSHPMGRIFPRFYFGTAGGIEAAVFDTAEVKPWRPDLARNVLGGNVVGG